MSKVFATSQDADARPLVVTDGCPRRIRTTFEKLVGFAVVHTINARPTCKRFNAIGSSPVLWVYVTVVFIVTFLGGWS